jgi:hypothetical protein
MQKIQTSRKIISQARARFQRISPFKVRRIVRELHSTHIDPLRTTFL